ncbi:hypothetical protein ACFLW1_02680 [Chloroflexota bacterium]
MVKITNIHRALLKASSRFELGDEYEPEDYQLLHEAASRSFLAQAQILELRLLGQPYWKIGNGAGVDERTVRAWLQGIQCPTLEHAFALSKSYLEVMNAG